jgi:hypothetical protein
MRAALVSYTDSLPRTALYFTVLDQNRRPSRIERPPQALNPLTSTRTVSFTSAHLPGPHLSRTLLVPPRSKARQEAPAKNAVCHGERWMSQLRQIHVELHSIITRPFGHLQIWINVSMDIVST